MLSRRAALKGGTATVAAITATGAAAPCVAAGTSPVAEAAEAYWAAAEHYCAGAEDRTQEENDVVWCRLQEVYQRLIDTPSASVEDLGIKVAVYREEWFGIMIDMNDPSQLGGLLADIERLAGRAES